MRFRSAKQPAICSPTQPVTAPHSSGRSVIFHGPPPPDNILNSIRTSFRMELKPEQITIAVTVYNRRDYLPDAIQSALNQTVPVRVIVVEDCGPDPGLR